MPIVIAHDVPGAAAMVASNIGQYATARQQQEDALRNMQVQQQWNQQARGNAIQEMQLGREWQQQDIANQFRNEQLRMAEERAAEQGAQGWAKLAQDEQLRLQQQQSLDTWRNMQDQTRQRGQNMTYSLGQDKLDVQEANLKQQKEWHESQLREKQAEFQTTNEFRRAQLSEEMKWHVEQIYLANAKLTQTATEKEKDRQLRRDLRTSTNGQIDRAAMAIQDRQYRSEDAAIRGVITAAEHQLKRLEDQLNFGAGSDAERQAIQSQMNELERKVNEWTGHRVALQRSYSTKMQGLRTPAPTPTPSPQPPPQDNSAMNLRPATDQEVIEAIQAVGNQAATREERKALVKALLEQNGMYVP